jgi:hypothetical protein
LAWIAEKVHRLKTSDKKTFWWFLPAVFAAGFIFIAFAVPSERRFPQGDLLDYYIPLADWVGERFSNGELPLWNPNLACGLDQFSTMQAAPFYLPHLMHAVLPGPWSQYVLALIHLVIAGVGIQAWLRCNERTRSGAIFGTTAFLFGIVIEAWWPTMLSTLAWFPWLLYAVDAEHLSLPKRFAIGIAATGLQILAGFPQLVLYTGMFVSGYILIKAIAERRKALLFGTVAVVMIGAMIGAVQLVPSYLYSKGTWRPGVLRPEHVHYDRNFNEVENKSIVADAREMARQSTEFFGYIPEYPPQRLSTRFYGYVGFFMPLAVGMALLSRWNWRTGFFVIAAVIAMFLSQGYLTWLPVYDYLAKTIPFMGNFRTPSRFLIVVLMTCSALTAAGVTEIWQSPRNRKWYLVRLAVVAVTILGITAMRFKQTFVMNIVPLVIVVGFIVYALRDAEHRQRFTRGTQWIVYGLLLINLWLARTYIHRHLDPDFSQIQLTKSVALDSDDIAPLSERVGHNRLYLAANYWPVMRTRESPQWRGLSVYEASLSKRHFMLNSALKFPGEMPQQSHFTFHEIPMVPHLRFFDQCSVETVVSPVSVENALDHGWQEIAKEEGYFVYENTRCVNRATLHRNYRIVTSDEASKWLLASSDSDSDSDSETADTLLLEEEPSKEWLDAARAAVPSEMGELKWIADRPENLEFEVPGDAPSLLVITDSWAPGWKCLVDGVPRKVMHANYLFRCVELMPGERKVTLSFSPPGLKPGAVISVLGLIIGAGLIGWLRWRTPSTATATATATATDATTQGIQ